MKVLVHKIMIHELNDRVCEQQLSYVDACLLCVLVLSRVEHNVFVNSCPNLHDDSFITCIHCVYHAQCT